MKDVDPKEGDEGVAECKADGTDEDDNRQAAEGTPFVFFDFAGMGFLFCFFGFLYEGQDVRHAAVDDEGQDGIDDAEDGQSPDVKGVGTGAGDDRSYGKAGIAADGKGSQGLAFLIAGDVIDHAGCFGMIDGGAEAAEHGEEEDKPVVLGKAQEGQADPAEDGP